MTGFVTACKLYIRMSIREISDIIGSSIYTERIDEYLEEKHIGEFRGRRTRVFNGWKFSN